MVARAAHQLSKRYILFLSLFHQKVFLSKATFKAFILCMWRHQTDELQLINYLFCFAAPQLGVYGARAVTRRIGYVPGKPVYVILGDFVVFITQNNTVVHYTRKVVFSGWCLKPVFHLRKHFQGRLRKQKKKLKYPNLHIFSDQKPNLISCKKVSGKYFSKLKLSLS